ncbi:hypothetical protein AAI421_21350 [Rhodococcus aetherivorans]|uniref:hypothetical protein n=1 Tax=Rhodococcus aetherivorans TaxID=191292 RepID=UPI0031DE052F
MTATKNVADGGAATPDSVDDAENRTALQERTDPVPNLTFFDLQDLLTPIGATEEEILSYQGQMRDEVEAAAVEAGRLRQQWRSLPLWTDADVSRIRRLILAERAELAGIDTESGAADDETRGAAAIDDPFCACGHSAEVHGRLFGCWSVRESGGRKCACKQYAPAVHADELCLEQLATAQVGDRLRLTFDRLDAVSPTGARLPSEYLLSFGKPVGVDDFPELHPEQIPALIDELTVIYRQWRDLAEREGEL